jgi:hypothetical protein
MYFLQLDSCSLGQGAIALEKAPSAKCIQSWKTSAKTGSGLSMARSLILTSYKLKLLSLFAKDAKILYLKRDVLDVVRSFGLKMR